MMKDCLNSKRGFTLIELLIVIALLGAIAVGMLAAIDPLEQFKKGNDTSTRNTVSEVYNAMIRYYAIKTKFPWGTDTWDTPIAAVAAEAQSYISEVIVAGELKTDFVELAGTDRLGGIFLTAETLDHLTVCYQPASKSFQKDPNTKYASSDGVDTSTDCKSGAGTADCWWCVK